MTWILLAFLAHDPITTRITWDAEIYRIVVRRCVSCHAAGKDVDLSTYELARPWAKSIRNQILQRRMPPWAPIKGFGDFRNDPSLTPLEMEMLTQWVEGGAPEGDPAFLPRQQHLVRMTVPPAVRTQPAPASFPRATTLTAIRATGPTEVSAILPDRSVKHLLWIRDKTADWNQIYYFREPAKLPAGAKLQVTGAPVWISAATRP